MLIDRLRRAPSRQQRRGATIPARRVGAALATEIADLRPQLRARHVQGVGEAGQGWRQLAGGWGIGRLTRRGADGQRAGHEGQRRELHGVRDGVPVEEAAGEGGR